MYMMPSRNHYIREKVASDLCEIVLRGKYKGKLYGVINELC